MEDYCDLMTLLFIWLGNRHWVLIVIFCFLHFQYQLEILAIVTSEETQDISYTVNNDIPPLNEFAFKHFVNWLKHNIFVTGMMEIKFSEVGKSWYGSRR